MLPKRQQMPPDDIAHHRESLATATPWYRMTQALLQATRSSVTYCAAASASSAPPQPSGSRLAESAPPSASATSLRTLTSRPPRSQAMSRLSTCARLWRPSEQQRRGRGPVGTATGEPRQMRLSPRAGSLPGPRSHAAASCSSGNFNWVTNTSVYAPHSASRAAAAARAFASKLANFLASPKLPKSTLMSGDAAADDSVLHNVMNSPLAPSSNKLLATTKCGNATLTLRDQLSASASDALRAASTP
mmetsp:Transcript_44427/g.128411  ORF Transcript_44427/g.128411 Transcript_44427/m.128411 type:complete len:246 (+) Transcript_44427:234-971(+)